MGKIGDLWVRLGLKKSEFDKGLDEAARKTTNFSSVLKKIGTVGAAAFGAVAVGVMGAISLVKELSKENQVLGDAWGKTTAEMAAMWDTFKTAIASTDFTHIIQDLGEAKRLAGELYDAADALGEIGTAYNIDLARQMKHINELKVQLRDVNLSEEKRKKAGEELLEIYRKLEANPTRGLDAFSDASLDVMADKLGLKVKGITDKELAAVRKSTENFLVWLGTETGETWNNRFKKAIQANDVAALTKTAQAAMNQGVSSTLVTMLTNYNKRVGEDDRKKTEEAVTAAYMQQAKYSGETLRIQWQINNLKHQQATGGSGGTDTGLEQANKIQENAVLSGKSPVQRLADKYEQDKFLLVDQQQDITARTEQFVHDLAAALTYDANPNNVLDSFSTAPERLERNFNEIENILAQHGLNVNGIPAEIMEKYNRLMIQAEGDLKKSSDAQAQELDDWVAEWIAAFAQINGLDVNRVTEAVTADVKQMANDAGNAAENMADALDASMERMERLVDEFTDSVVGGFSDGIQELTDQLMGVSDINADAVFQALLSPLADMAVREGEILMAAGLGVEAVKKSLESLNGVAAIVAGASLIAIGAAAKSGLAALANGGSSTTANYSGTGGGTGTQTIRSELTVKVEGIVRGRDIVLSGQNTINDYNR